MRIPSARKCYPRARYELGAPNCWITIRRASRPAIAEHERHRPNQSKAPFGPLRSPPRLPLHSLMQIPIGLQSHPQLRRRLQQPCEPKRGVRCDATLSENNLVQTVERDAEPLRRFELTEAERLQILFQQDLPWRNRRTQPSRISSDSLRRGRRTHVRSPTETSLGTVHSPGCCGGRLGRP